MADPYDVPDLDDEGAVKARFAGLYEPLAKEIEDEIRRFDPQKLPSVLYHYTNPRGLKGIVEDSSLHLTDSFFLNDKSEIIYGRDLAREVIAEYAATSQPETREFLTRVASKFNILTEDRHEIQHYVACFCSDGNLLSQWRAYGFPDGGVALGFPFEVLSKLRDHLQPGSPHVVLHRIEYKGKPEETVALCG